CRRWRREIEDVAAHADAGEAPPGEIRPELRRREPGWHRQAECDHRAGVAVLRQQRVHDGLGRVRGSEGTAARTVNPADLGEEQAEVIGDLGGGAHGGARRPDRILLLERDGRTDLLDLVHVRTVDAVEEHPRVRRQRLDVAPLALGEEGVEGEGGLAGAGYPGHDRETVVRDLERDVLEIVLSGSLDAKPEGPSHSSCPPEVGSLLEVGGTRQPGEPLDTRARRVYAPAES